MKKKYRIKSTVRFTVFMAIMVIAVLVVSGNLLGLNNASGMSEPDYIAYEIQSGDTLWDLAGKYTDCKDIRKAVHAICTENNISAGEIYPGLVIQIPSEV